MELEQAGNIMSRLTKDTDSIGHGWLIAKRRLVGPAGLQKCFCDP